jgi:CRISPR-associated protein Csm1
MDINNISATTTALILREYGIDDVANDILRLFGCDMPFEKDMSDIAQKAQRIASGFGDTVDGKEVQPLCHIAGYLSKNKEKYFLAPKIMDANKNSFLQTAPSKEEIKKHLKNMTNAISMMNTNQYKAILLEDLDSLLESYTGCVGATSDIPLYEHIRQSSAIATALWIYQKADDKASASPFLFVQGDFFGIQKFIFASSVEHNKKMAQILRGKSAGVTLLSELCALALLEQLGLSPFSLSRNAAGKFVVIVPNTLQAIEHLNIFKHSAYEWFLQNFYGEFGIALSWCEASEEELGINPSANANIKNFFTRANLQLELEKANKFNLLDAKEHIFHGYTEEIQKTGVCPACERRAKTTELCHVCGAFKELGSKLADAKNSILYIYKSDKSAKTFAPFGYSWSFADEKERKLVRRWDISLPDKSGTIPNIKARRTLRAYIPYAQTFEDIAAKSTGIDALAAIKADVDNLGELFARRIHGENIAPMSKTTALSHQINRFFTHRLPFLISSINEPIYTVFAGGDDLFLIGAWDSVLKFAETLKAEFDDYFLSPKTNLSFSAGVMMFKSGVPVPHIAHATEEALERAKGVDGKGAICIFDETVRFDDFVVLSNFSAEVEIARKELGLHTSYLRNALYYADEAKKSKTDIYATKWSAHFRYQSARNVIDKAKHEREKAQNFVEKLGAAITLHTSAVKIALIPILYKERRKS